MKLRMLLLLTADIGIVGVTGTVGTLLGNSEPSAYTLENAYIPKDKYKDKFGEKNRRVLIANVEGNRRWWNWSFRNNYTTDMGKVDHFKDIKQGYGDDDAVASLNRKCEEAYEKEKSTVNGLKDAIKKLCSVGSTDLVV